MAVSRNSFGPAVLSVLDQHFFQFAIELYGAPPVPNCLGNLEAIGFFNEQPLYKVWEKDLYAWYDPEGPSWIINEVPGLFDHGWSQRYPTFDPPGIYDPFGSYENPVYVNSL